MRAPAAWDLVAESWRPGVRRDPEGEWALAGPHLDCQPTFFLFAFFFFVCGGSGGTSQTGAYSEKELGYEAAALLYLPFFPPLRFCFSSLRTSFPPLVLNSFFPP